MTNWIMRHSDANIPLMANVLGVSQITARVMANRGIRTKNTALSFLNTSINNLRPFLDMKGAASAICRINTAINLSEKITVYGDYDADGITATAILYKVLVRLGANVTYYIPHRVSEGYGLNNSAVKSIAALGTKLIITVDNGISAIEEVTLATKLGIDTIIVDHHEPGDKLPRAVAIVDPKQQDCPYPFKELCAGGLVFKLADALCRHMGKPFVEHDESLVLAAIATICDIVSLKDENRILANCGMIILNSNKLINPGLGSLITMRGYLDKPIDTFTMGFVLGPCINAAGRLSSADVALQLLITSTEDVKVRMSLTQELIELNDGRRQMTSDCTNRILASLPPTSEMDKVLVITDTETHESISGIVAGRVKETTGRPTIVLTQGDNAMKGSGRSPSCYNLFEALNANNHLLTKFGGHAMAAGVTLPNENIPLLREALNSNCNLTEADFIKSYEIDAELCLQDISLSLADELTRLAPFGRDNGEPMFVIRNIFTENVRVLDEKNTLIFTFRNYAGARVKGIAFGLNEQYADAISNSGAEKDGGYRMDVVFHIETNTYNNMVSVQIKVKDFKIIQEV